MIIGCTFCRIFAGELPVSYVYRDDWLAVLMDLYPVTPGHMLIIPYQHVVSMTQMNPEVASSMMTRAQQLGKAIMSSELGCEGFNLYLADGEAAGQDVFHVHLHVIPRYRGDGFRLAFPPGYPKEAQRSDLDSRAETIRRALESFR
jgi:histidine triad (HIT) family protein